jgi:hypothetical protein
MMPGMVLIQVAILLVSVDDRPFVAVPMACSSTGMGFTTALAAMMGTASANGAVAAFSVQFVSRRSAKADRTTVICRRRFICQKRLDPAGDGCGALALTSRKQLLPD